MGCSTTTWVGWAVAFCVAEAVAGVWLCIEFSGRISDKALCVAQNIIDAQNVNTSLLPADVNAELQHVQDEIRDLPQGTVNFVLDYIQFFGVILALPAFLAFLFLAIASCGEARSKNTCCKNTVLILHGIFALWAFAVAIVGAYGGFFVNESDVVQEQVTTFETSCDTVRTELRDTIGNLTVAIHNAESANATQSQINELKSARSTAVEMQSIVVQLCACFLELLTSFGLLSNAGIFGAVVFFLAFVVGCFGCCCTGADESATAKRNGVPKMDGIPNGA